MMEEIMDGQKKIVDDVNLFHHIFLSQIEPVHQLREAASCVGTDGY